MTFEEWFKIEHGSYISEYELFDDYEDHISQYKVDNMLRKAFEAGYQSGWNEALDQHAD